MPVHNRWAQPCPRTRRRPARRSENTPTRLDAVVTTRRASRDDLAAVEDVTRAAYTHYIARIGLVPAPMNADYGALIEAGSVWVAEQTGVIIGLVVLQAHPDHLLIESIAASPSEQGRGIGRLLLDLAEREATALGLDEIRLYTNEAMTENLAYYPRRGYVETHRSSDKGFRRVFFRKRLSAKSVAPPDAV